MTLEGFYLTAGAMKHVSLTLIRADSQMASSIDFGRLFGLSL